MKHNIYANYSSIEIYVKKINSGNSFLFMDDNRIN